MMKPNRSMSKKLLELVNDRLHKTEQALFQFKLNLEKDSLSKPPSDLLSIVDEICSQLPHMPAKTSREIVQRLQPMIQTLNEIIEKLSALNSNPTTRNQKSVNKAVKLYKQVQNTKKVL